MSELKRQIAVERLKGFNVTGLPPFAKAGICGGSLDFHETRSFLVVPIGHCGAPKLTSECTHFVSRLSAFVSILPNATIL